jgi:threonine/homoserine/homoserine lactone efflux protein
VATADSLAAAIAALGITLVSGFLIDHQLVLRLIGGAFLCYLGYTIYMTEPVTQAAIKSINGLFSAYATTFLLTFSNPVTILSFVAIYAGWHVPSLNGQYVAAATLTLGVFVGSALWWIALFIGLEAFHEKFNLRFLFWVHRVSGAIIALLRRGATAWESNFERKPGICRVRKPGPRYSRRDQSRSGAFLCRSEPLSIRISAPRAVARQHGVGVDAGARRAVDQSLLEFDPRDDSRSVPSQPDRECVFRAAVVDPVRRAVSHPAHEPFGAS